MEIKLTPAEDTLIKEILKSGFIYRKFLSKEDITLANKLVARNILYKSKPAERNATIAYYSNIK